MKAYHNSVVLRNDGEDPSTLKLDLNAGITEQVTVRINSTQALASIFDVDDVGTANPLTTDNNGNYAFKAADNIYDIIVAEGTANEIKLEKVEIAEIPIPSDLINDLSQAYEFATVAAYKAFATAFPLTKRIYLADRDAYFTIISGTGTADGFGVIGSDQVSQSIDIINGGEAKVKQFGGKGDGATVDDGAISAAIATGLPLRFEYTGSFYKVSSAIVINTMADHGKFQIFEDASPIQFNLNAVAEVCPEWWGAVSGDDSLSTVSTVAFQSAIDSTTPLSAASAINEGTTLHNVVSIGAGVYLVGALTITEPVIIRGSGMKQTLIKAPTSNISPIIVTATAPIEITDLSFGMKNGVAAHTSGSIITIAPTVIQMDYALIERVAFNNFHTAISATAAAYFSINKCYFNAYTGTGISVANTLSPDSGDSSITGCTWNNGVGVAIFQQSSGGLRIVDNKFLGGTLSYHGDFNEGVSATGQLIIANNSFDQCTVANIRLSKTALSTFSLISITDNIIVVSPGKVGILMDGYVGETAFYNTTIGGNNFYLRDLSTAVLLSSCYGTTLFPNAYTTDGGETSTGVTFGAFPIANTIIHPQSFNGSITKFSGTQTGVLFVAGEGVEYAGDPNNNITPNYKGELCFDTTNSKWYKSFGIVGNQWAIIS